jgi:hypothetical protein
MFKEACTGRGYISDTQMKGPLTHEEIAAAVRGRHRWNPEARVWEIAYRPFRDFWIVLLFTVNEKIFALQAPRIVPDRIKAQYEVEDEFRATQNDMSY